MLVVGLTGGIGSGKSIVTQLFAELNVPIIDADLVAREITQPNTFAFKEIKKHFGKEILENDGQLNRAALRDIIFSNANERTWLERLVHPIIKEEMEKKIKALNTPYCITVIPLLFEVEFYFFINRILVVDTPEDLQIARVMARDKMEREDVEKILNAQAKRIDRKARAHDIIVNDGDIDDLKPQVVALHQKYLTLAQSDFSG